jgi:hypothetical protein
MQKAKLFFYLSMGVLALSIAFHLGVGASSAVAQTEYGVAVGFSGDKIITASGEIWKWESHPNYVWTLHESSPWPGGAVATEPSSFSSIKAKFGK